jgi:ureidoacrylate peracid hydrolase
MTHTQTFGYPPMEHRCSSGFANADLDLQLKKHGIHQLIVIGLIAHTCIEATVRYAVELGYEVTVVKDATADYSDEEMHAALDTIFRITPMLL